MRKFLLAIVLIIIVLIAVAVAAVLHLRNIKPNYDKEVGDAVAKPVEIWRDSAGVPHVWAQGDGDLYFAQGYIHAQERLWQMELMRRVAEGRLSEIFGERMIDTDKFLRTIGLWRSAELNEKSLNQDEQRLLQSYVNGVNAWIERHDGPLPPEFTVLRIKPEPWTIRHSLAVEKVMSWDLALYSDAANLTAATRALGPEKAKWLAPSDPAWGATIVETPRLENSDTLFPAIPEPAAQLLDALSITHASNAWVIGGSRTTSGKPILANDMHLMLRQPGVWYLMALHAPDMDVVGMTLPGVPNVIAGHNRAVAWGFTNVMMDDVDFFIERLDPTDTTRYHTPNGPEPFNTVVERVSVKGHEQPEVFTIRISRHGPIVSDVEKRFKRGDVLAMQWAALDSSHSLQAFPRFNRAHNAAEFLAAVPLFDNPHQNIVYADTAGHFGYQMGGRIPVRGARRLPPMLPVPGWDGQYDWLGYIPYAEQPAAHDPANGYAITANNRQVRSAVGDLISNDWEMPYRAMRIREMVLAAPKQDAQSVHRMQLDVKDLLAVRYRDRAVAAARSARLNNVAQELAAWDGTAERGSTAAAYFYAWYEMLRAQLRQNLFGNFSGGVSRNVTNQVLDSGRVLWLGNSVNGRAVLDSLSWTAMLQADSIARGKNWGQLHEVVIEHALGTVRTLDGLLRLNVGPEPHRGSPTTVNVAQYTGSKFPMRTSYGPSERHVVDMANVDGVGGFILPTGESGLPGTQHYADMFERWRNGGLWLIPLDRAKASARVVHRMVIKPRS